MTLPLDIVLAPDHADTVGGIPIRANAANPEPVDRADIQDALAEAGAVFGLAMIIVPYGDARGAQWCF